MRSIFGLAPGSLAAALALVGLVAVGASPVNAQRQPKQPTAAPTPPPADLPIPDDAAVAKAVTEAVALLVKREENYKSDADAKQARARKPAKGQSQEDFAKEEAARQKAEELWKKSIEALRAGPGHEWPYEGVVRDSFGDIPPGYRVGGTSITCMALMDAPGLATDAPRRAAILQGIEFCMMALETHPMMTADFDGGYDVRGWGHAYGLGLLLHAKKMAVLDAKQTERAEKLIRRMIKTLEDTELVGGGGWNYSRPGGGKKPGSSSTFMTAPTLQFLFTAKAAGYAVRDDVVQRALKTLSDARLEKTGSFQYGTHPQTGKGSSIEELPGACARMAVCETTLMLAGRGNVDHLRGAVKAFFSEWQWLEDRRKKPGTHEGPYAVAPYFFHYGHTFVAQAIEQLPEAERAPLRGRLRALYWHTREPDGGWNDRIFPRTEGFGTAMAIAGLLMPTLPPPATYQSPESRPAGL